MHLKITIKDQQNVHKLLLCGRICIAMISILSKVITPFGTRLYSTWERYLQSLYLYQSTMNFSGPLGKWCERMPMYVICWCRRIFIQFLALCQLMFLKCFILPIMYKEHTWTFHLVLSASIEHLFLCDMWTWGYFLKLLIIFIFTC